MFEFEGRAVDEGVLDDFVDRAEEWGLAHVVERVRSGYSELTPSGGVHWFFRCSPAETNLKLARRPATTEELQARPDDRVKVLIETRGEGGFSVVAPSHGSVHPSGGCWSLLDGGFDTIATLTQNEREDLHNLARSFDAMQPTVPEAPMGAVAGTEDVIERAFVDNGPLDQGRPGDDFNNDPDVQQKILAILENHGWQVDHKVGDVVYLTRPGRDSGTSATLGHVAPGWLYVFTTSSVFDAGRAYSPFAVYAILEHEGDFKAAAKVLVADGYGTATGGGCERFTDTGNAHRFAAMFRDEYRFVHEQKTWLHWNSNCWEPDVKQTHMQAAQAVAQSLYDLVNELEVNGDEEDLVKGARAWARTSESSPRLESMIKLASSEPTLAVKSGELDADQFLFNVRNGTIDLRTGELLSPNRDHLITRTAPVTFDPQANCPNFDRFLAQVLPDDDVREFLQTAIGYTLTGETNEQVLFFMHGTGGAGITTFQKAMQSIFGPYATQTETGLLQQRSEVHPTGLADLRGARMALATEIGNGRAIAESTLKRLTGSDTIKARNLYQNFFEFTPTHKLWISGNTRPDLSDTSHAMWRRVKVLPFYRSIPADKVDTNLSAKLLGERSGILNWALTGNRRWRESGLPESDRVAAITEEYRREANPVAEFIEQCCDLEPDHWTHGGELHEAYGAWAKNYDRTPLTRKAFAMALKDSGHLTTPKGTARRAHFSGLRLKA